MASPFICWLKFVQVFWPRVFFCFYLNPLPENFGIAVVSILLYGCTTWTLTKRLEEKLDGNYIRMLRAILNQSWWQHPTRHQLYGRLPPITKTIQVRRTRHAGHCWRSRDELISDVLLWNPTYGRAKTGRPARTYIQQLCEDTGCSPEDLQEAMNDREKWRERVRDIRAGGMTWWWWFSWVDSTLCIYQYVVQSNFNFLHNSQWITFPTQSCLVLNSFMRLTLSSLSPHEQRLLFVINFCINIIGLYGNFFEEIKRDSVSLLWHSVDLQISFLKF